jgi:gliding motility-associated-like protein
MKNIIIVLLIFPLYLFSQFNGYLGKDTLVICHEGTGDIKPSINKGSLPIYYEWEWNIDYFFVPPPDTLTEYGTLNYYPQNVEDGQEYVLYINDKHGCLYHKDYFVMSLSPLQLNYIIVSEPTCHGRKDGSVFFNISGSKSPYRYMINGTLVDKNFVENLESGNYELTILDSKDCELVTDFFIPKGPLKPFERINLISNCNNVLIDIIGDSGPYELELNEETLLTNVISVKENIDYKLTIRDKYSCEFDTILPLFNLVEFNIDEIIIKNPECPEILDGSIKIIESDNISYQWLHTNLDTNYIDGLDMGFYNVHITNLDNKCEINFEFKLEYDRLACMIIPTAFSPNGDGVNDHWDIENINRLYPNVNIEVYDRWGEIVFKSTNGYLIPWDGTKNGMPLPVNSYHYIIDLKNGERPRIGQVSIIR